MRVPHPHLAALLIVSSGCVNNLGSLPDGSLTGDEPLAMPTDGDAGTPVTDPSDGGGDDAAMPAGDPDAGDAASDAPPPPPPPPPCDGVTCGVGAMCVAETGECVCVDGYRPVGGACEVIPPGDPAGRTIAAVCARWRDGHVENARPAWTPGGTACTGVLTAGAYEDTTRRINLFRWLAGLPPVVHEISENAAMQECAIMIDQNGALSHSPPATWACYTAAGAGAAGRSNLALGVSSPGQAIDLYMVDARVASLGHRRWILSNLLGRVGIGFAGRGQCLGVFDMSGRGDREWTSFPNPGPAPIDTARNVWSFNSRSINLSAATVLMERLGAAAAEIPVTTTYISGGFGPPSAVGWTPSVRAAAGERYRITIGGLSGADISYETEIVDCS